MAGELYPHAATPLRPGAPPPSRAILPEAARPLRAWSAADRERVAGALVLETERWTETWGLGARDPRSVDGRGGAAEPTVMTPFDSRWADQGLGLPAWRERWPAAWWAFGSGSGVGPRRSGGSEDAPHLAAIRSALFAGGVTPWSSSRGSEVERAAPQATLADGVARAAWDDWCERVAQGLRCNAGGLGDVERRVPPAQSLSRWSGALLVSLPWLDGTMRLLLEADCLEAMLPPRARQPASSISGSPILPVWRAAAGRKVPLSVLVEPFELEIGTLAGLRAGDVLRTDHRLEAALAVAMDAAAGERVCAAHLGRLGEHRAAELRRTAPSPDETPLRAGRNAGERTT